MDHEDSLSRYVDAHGWVCKYEHVDTERQC